MAAVEGFMRRIISAAALRTNLVMATLVLAASAHAEPPLQWGVEAFGGPITSGFCDTKVFTTTINQGNDIWLYGISGTAAVQPNPNSTTSPGISGMVVRDVLATLTTMSLINTPSVAVPTSTGLTNVNQGIGYSLYSLILKQTGAQTHHQNINERFPQGPIVIPNGKLMFVVYRQSTSYPNADNDCIDFEAQLMLHWSSQPPLQPTLSTPGTRGF